jgi:methionine-rich copper-binding protein CopC
VHLGNSLRFRSAVIATLTFVMVAGAARASATAFHAALKKASPGINDTVTTSPDSLKLWFNEKVELPLTKVVLNGGGTAHKLSAAAMGGSAADSPIVFAVLEKLGAGKYTVDWTVAGKDGHPSKGTYDFVVKAPK